MINLRALTAALALVAAMPAASILINTRPAAASAVSSRSSAALRARWRPGGGPQRIQKALPCVGRVRREPS